MFFLPLSLGFLTARQNASSNVTMPYQDVVNNIIEELQLNTVDLSVAKILALVGTLIRYEEAEILIRAICEKGIANTRFAPMYTDFFVKIVERSAECNLKEDLRTMYVMNCQRLFDVEVKTTPSFKSHEITTRCLGIMRMLGMSYLYALFDWSYAEHNICAGVSNFKIVC